MKKIMMVCYGGGHVQIIKELYKKFLDVKEIEVTILSLTTSSKILEQEKIPFNTILDYYNENTDKEIYNLGKEFCINNNIDTFIGEMETFLYHGYALYELIEKYGKKVVEEGFKKLGRKIFLPVLFMEKILKQEKPNILITTNSPRYERASLIAAKKMGIKNLTIEDLFGVKDGAVSSEMANYFNDEIYEDIYGEYLCVISEESKRNLEKNKTNKIFVTGNPSFDKTLRLFLEQKQNQMKKVTQRKTMCFLSQNLPDKFIVLDKIIEISHKKKYDLIIKIHPNEKKEDYLNRLGEKLEGVFIEDSNLYENILKSDIVITIDSTSSLEAIILDKPVIGRKNKFIPFKNMGIGLEYENIGEIEELVDKIVYDKKIIEELKTARDAFRPENFAADSIKNIVEKILKNEE